MRNKKRIPLANSRQNKECQQQEPIPTGKISFAAIFLKIATIEKSSQKIWHRSLNGKQTGRYHGPTR
jgi:hypothetical protein